MRENKSGFVKFIVSVLVFVLLVAVSLGGYFAVQYIKGKNSPSSFGPELYYALDLAEEKTEYTKVIIGDSVARLIFSPDYQDETDLLNGGIITLVCSAWNDTPATILPMLCGHFSTWCHFMFLDDGLLNLDEKANISRENFSHLAMAEHYEAAFLIRK